MPIDEIISAENQKAIYTQKISVTAEVRITNYDEIVERVNKHRELTKTLKENIDALNALLVVPVTSLKQCE